MKKFSPSFVAVTVTIILYSHIGYASPNLSDDYSAQQCLIGVPTFNRPLVNGDINTLPVAAEANQFEAIYPNTAIYQGDVAILQGNRTANADKVTIETKENKDRIVTLDGNVVYQDNVIKMQGNNASLNLNSNDTHITQSLYHLVGRLGRGDADDMKLEQNRYIVLKNGSFTSCPVNDSSWNIEGSTIIHDNKEQLLEVWNAVFRIGKVPVLYSPYLQLPTGDKRRSGLLIPDLSYTSSDGVDFSLPFYWNIAPNYDATITPRIIQRRGIQLQTEFRYLNPLGTGTVALDWMQHDSLYNKDRDASESGSNYGNNRHRWLFHWRNEGSINENWSFYANSTRISDSHYLSDLGSDYAAETDGYFTQYYQLGYNNENWDIRLGYQHFQSFYSSIKNNLYQTEPQLNINYYNYDLGPFKFKTFAQISHFVSAGKYNPKTWRTHIEPTVDYTLTNSWASLTTTAAIMATHYDQDLDHVSSTYDYLKTSVNRVIPKLSADAKVVFERDTTFIDGYTQTLEPRVKYLYIPYRNQSKILSYDSTLLQSDYIGLFRDQPYSGFDRIASANKIATGVTTRFYDKNKVERFNLSLGQITYFTQSRTGDQNSELDKNRDTGSITWAADSFWRANDDIIFRAGVQYDARINTVSLANAIFEYQPSSEKLLQLSYRYANHNYIDAIGASSNTAYKQDISQAGVMVAWPLTNTVSAVGSYYYDVKLGQTVDSFAGLRYSDCCWGVTLRYGRKLTNWDESTRVSKYENKLSMTFELRGLGRNSNARAKMLSFGKLPYITAFE